MIDGAAAGGAWSVPVPLRRHHRALVGSVAYQVLRGSALLDIDVRTFGDRLVIELSGELRDAMCESLAEVFERALEGRQRAIVLDLRALEAIDHSGVRAILLACLRASDDHREFLIERGPDAVQRAFDAVNGPFRYTSYES